MGPTLIFCDHPKLGPRLWPTPRSTSRRRCLIPSYYNSLFYRFIIISSGGFSPDLVVAVACRAAQMPRQVICLLRWRICSTTVGALNPFQRSYKSFPVIIFRQLHLWDVLVEGYSNWPLLCPQMTGSTIALNVFVILVTPQYQVPLKWAQGGQIHIRIWFGHKKPPSAAWLILIQFLFPPWIIVKQNIPLKNSLLRSPKILSGRK